MERIKRFFMDDSATAEAVSTVIMVASVGILLAAAMLLYYTGINAFFNVAANSMSGRGDAMNTAISGIGS